jgi:hypothetical protein
VAPASPERLAGRGPWHEHQRSVAGQVVVRVEAGELAGIEADLIWVDGAKHG